MLRFSQTKEKNSKHKIILRLSHLNRMQSGVWFLFYYFHFFNLVGVCEV